VSDPPRLTGTVTRVIVEKGFGFIEAPNGVEYFFHKSATSPDCRDQWGGLALQQDDLVSFTINPVSTKGPRAEDVRLELPGVPAA